MAGWGAYVAGGHAWGVCGERGHAWQGGGMHGRGGMHGGHVWGVCMAGGMYGRGRAWQILRDTVNERAVSIQLECILFLKMF